MTLDLQRSPHLEKLAGGCAGVKPVAKTRKLHGNGGGPATAAPAQTEVPGGTEDGHRIDAGMGPEMLILLQECSADELRRDRGQRSPEPVFLIRAERQPEQLPFTVEHLRRKTFDLEGRWFREAEPAAESGGC